MLIISYVLLSIIVYFRLAGRKFYGVLSFSTIIWIGLLFVITEVLSLFDSISSATIALSWSIVIFLEIFVLIKCYSSAKIRKISLWNSVCQTLNNDPLAGVLIVILAFLLLRSTWVAVYTVANNWDSMTYHLARIIYWLKHGNVNYFDTRNIRQLVSPVLAEYINLHVIALTGNDIFVNLVQNLSGYLCVVFVYGLIRELGCGKKTALFGGILLLSMNAFSGESVTTQVDVFASMLLLAVSLLLVQMKDKKIELNHSLIFNYLLIGIGGGLIFIAKNNVALSAGIIALMIILVRLFSKDKPITVSIICLIAISAATAIVAPTFLRNYTLTGDIFASAYVGGIAIATKSRRLILLNMLKNFGNIAVNDHNASLLYFMVEGVGKLLGFDIDNPQISYGGYAYRLSYNLHHDYAGGSIVAMFIVLGLVIAVIYLFRKYKGINQFISMILILQFLVSIAVVRWQPWVVRLLLPSLALVIPGVVYFLNRVKNDVTEYCHSNAPKMLFLIMPILAILVCIGASDESYIYLKKPAVENLTGVSSRFDLYFYYRKDLAVYLDRICAAIRESPHSKLGIYSGGDSWQYPVLYTFYKETEQIENVVLQDAENPDERAQLSPGYSPDVIAVIDIKLDATKRYICNGSLYECIHALDIWSVWKKIE